MAQPTTFDAGLDELRYDFTKYQEGVAGVIPEPTSDQVETFLEVLRQVMPTSTDENGKTVLDLAALSERFGADDSEDIEALLNGAVAALCSNTPTAEQIGALPHRIKQRFYGWVLGTFLSPEA